MEGAIGKPPPRPAGRNPCVGGVSSAMRVAHDSSLCGGSLLGEPRLRTRRELSSVMRVAHDSFLCGGSQGGISPLRRRGGGRSPSGSFPIAPAAPSAPHLQACIVPKRWQVAAALSAAVTTAKPIGDARTLHGCASPQERTSLFPDALRERVREGGRTPGEAASLREASATSIGAADGRLFRLRKTAIAATGGYGCLSLPRAPSRRVGRKRGYAREAASLREVPQPQSARPMAACFG